MKKILKVVGVALCLVAFTQNSKAQFNVGLDVSMPMGNFGEVYGIGFGGSAGYDHAIGDKMKIGGQVGLLRFGGKNDDDGVSPYYKYYTSSTSLMLIPILGNFKYYFSDNTNGFYSSVSIGMSMYKYKNETSYTVSEWSGWDANYDPIYQDVKYSNDNSFNKTYLTYAVGVGYLINEKMDFGLRYTIVAGEGGSLAHLNLRAAYNF